MAASVQVLCPNGRRQNVKITPNTKLLQILEEVCKKQGFIPPEDYILKHGKNQVDLSLSIRFAGLSNNAKLELVKSSFSRQEQDVMIALQLETGKRVQGTFPPSVTLWEILLNFEEKNSECSGQLTKSCDLQPVCIFMQEQVVGEPALKATSLKRLGLISGKAIIRLLHRPMEDAVMADICEKVEKDKARETRLDEIAEKKQLEVEESCRPQVQEETPECTLTRTSARSSDTIHGDSPKPQEPSSTESRDKYPRMEVSKELCENELPSQNMCESSITQRDEGSVEENTLSESASKSDSLPKSGSSSQDTKEVSSSQDGASSNPIEDLRNLNIPGVEIFTPDDFRDLSPQEQVIAQRLARRFLPHLQSATVVTNPSGLESHEKQKSQESFANFKFPEETKGKDLSAGHYLSRKGKDSEPCERQIVIYNASESLVSTENSQEEELPEDFFEITQADVCKMYRDLQKSVQELEEQPLLTQAMREMKAQAACDKYEQVVIRVHFPDKLVLQAFFRPRETVKTLYAFVRMCLQDKKRKFYLYTSSYLEDRLKDQAISRQEAETVVAKVRQSHVEKTEAVDSQPGPSGTQRKIMTATRPSTSSSSSGPSGVPKWLKLSKK